MWTILYMDDFHVFDLMLKIDHIQKLPHLQKMKVKQKKLVNKNPSQSNAHLSCKFGHIWTNLFLVGDTHGNLGDILVNSKYNKPYITRKIKIGKFTFYSVQHNGQFGHLSCKYGHFSGEGGLHILTWDRAKWF